MDRSLRLSVLCLFGFCLCMAGIFCGCSKSAWGRVGNVGVGVSSTADYVSTRAAMQQGHTEANPILGQSAWRQALVKIGGAGAVIGLAWLMEARGRETLAHLMRAVVIAGFTVVTIHNVGVLR